MVGPSSPLKLLHPLQSFSLKSPSPNSNSMKIKNLLHTLIISHVCKIIRAMSKAKSACIATIKAKCQFVSFIYSTKDKKANKKMFFGSFRMHYNWCSSSHVMPLPPSVLDCTYYDSSWNSVIVTEQDEDNSEAQLSGYLKWLEEEKLHCNSPTEKDMQHDMNDIDKLAEIFIASCHEKFILEKQESCRRFQEMLARSL